LHGVARCGTATVFPQAIGLAATFDTELLQEIGDCISTEGRAKYNEAIKHNDRGLFKGLTYWSPNVNIFRDPRWGRGHETYGEDPVLTSRMGVAFVKGLQGDGEYMKAAACAKHFAVHSGPEGLRHHFDAKTSLKDLWETYLPGFEACVKEADVEAVMGAYNRTNGEVCCAHSYLMDDVLKDGFILMDSDILLIRDIGYIWDEKFAAGGRIIWYKGRAPYHDRLQPYVCYLNVPVLREAGIKFYEPTRCWGLMPGGTQNSNNLYDTGASLLEDIVNSKPKVWCRNYQDLEDDYVHFANASYSHNILDHHKEWLESYKHLYE
jgi:hypothetical protein